MSYKFQVGPAILSGTVVHKDALSVESTFSATAVSASGAVSGFSLDIEGSADVDGNLDVGGLFKMADNTSGKLLVADGTSYQEVAMSGDVAIASGGATTIQADAVEGSMLNDNVISGQTDLGSAAAAQGDELLFSDDGTLKKITFSDLEDSIFGNVSGDATITAGGALTIAATSVETGMLANDAVTPAKLSIFDDSLAAGDTKVLIGDGSDYSEFALSGDVTMTNAGVVSIGAQKVTNAMLADDAVGADELASNAVVNASIASNAAIDMDKLDGGSLAASLSDAAQTDLLYVGDDDGSGGFALKSITFSDFEDAIFGNLSGDATVAAGGALTISADSVHGTMLSTDSADGTTLELSGDSLSVLKVPNALSQGDGIAAFSYDGSGALTVALSASVAGAGLDYASGVLKVNIDEFSALGGATLHQTQDKFLVSDNGVEKTVTFSNLQDSVFADVSGDATIAAGGALTLGTGVVEHAMLAEDIISGQDELAHADIADADDLMISDNGTIKRVGVDSLRDHFFGVVSGDATIADGGALTLGSGVVEHGMLADDIITGQGANTDPQDDDLMLLGDSSASNEVKKITLANLGVYFGGGLPQARGDASVNLTEGVNYGDAAITADRTWKLPATADLTFGDKVVVKAGLIGSGFKITVSPNVGQSIDDGAVVELQEDFAAVTVVYVASNTWRII